MRIAHVNMFYAPTFGGVEKVMQELAERQIREGHEVHVFCCDSDKYSRIKLKHEVINGVHVHRIPYLFRLSFNTFFWPGLISKLKKHGRFDVIHSHVSGHDYVLFSGLAAKKMNALHVHTTHCPWTDKFRRKLLRIIVWLNDKLVNRLSFKYVDKVVSITPWEHSELLKWVPKSKIINIPNGMDKVFFSKVEDNDFKSKGNIPDNKMVLFFGRLNPTKAPEVLADVAVQISKERDDISFVFVGPDEGKKDEIASIIKGHKNIFLFDGLRDRKDIVKMYQSADVYVLPSYREGLPLTLFEAMASGLPIIASPVNGIPFEMEDNVNGFFVDYGDKNNLKRRILEVLDNPELSKKFASNNREKAKLYDWDVIYKRYMEVYNGQAESNL